MKRPSRLGLTLASGLLAAGCSAPSTQTNPSVEHSPVVRPSGECIADTSGYRFVGYWALHMDGLMVTSADKAQHDEVLQAATAASDSLAKQYPNSNYGTLFLTGAVTHEQYTQYIADTKMPGGVQDVLVNDSIVHAHLPRGNRDVTYSLADASMPGAFNPSIDASVPVPNSETTYAQAVLTIPEQNIAGCM